MGRPIRPARLRARIFTLYPIHFPGDVYVLYEQSAQLGENGVGEGSGLRVPVVLTGKGDGGCLSTPRESPDPARTPSGGRIHTLIHTLPRPLSIKRHFVIASVRS